MKDKIIPFGKYKGQALEILAGDKKYTDWLLVQSWFKEEHLDLYNTVSNNFREALDTPEFVEIQNKLLKPEFRVKLAYLVNPDLFKQNSEKINMEMKSILKITKGSKNLHFLKSLANPIVEDEFGLYTMELLKLSKPSFEGVDAYFSIFYGLQFYYDNENFYGGWSQFRQETCTSCWVDIKPVVGDDYPLVLRQLKASMPVGKNEHMRDKFFILLIGDFVASSTSKEECVLFFAENGYIVVFEEEIGKVVLPDFEREFKLDPEIGELLKKAMDGADPNT